MKQCGVEITYSPFETEELKKILYTSGNAAQKVRAVIGNINKRRLELATVGDFDLVYVFREAALLGPAWFERKVAATGVPMVFDFDDAVFVAYKSPSNGYLSYLKFPGKTATTLKLSAHVIAGNPYLAEYSGQFNDNVTIIPTTIDTDKYTVADNGAEPEILTIGWSGSYSTVQHLDTIRDVLQELAATEKFRLRVIGTSAYDLPGVEVEAIEWTSAKEIEDLEAFDIGVMPLPDDQWSKGKCGLKALQYMALGVPTICSPVGVNSDIIQDGVNGFLADGKQEWIRKIKELLHSKELRRSVGLAGRKTVEEKYSAIGQAPRVLEVFKTAIGDKQKG
ncbi:MAG: glycosyltransferase family 4 protein [Saprospiraceae bacterium]|nr:glycosyltransferase family 4 protein [Pyrinomonadaceae bacterium]